MIATCPNDPAHNRFLTTAHVVEEWEVDRNGNFSRVTQSLEVTHDPSPDNIWMCAVCGAEATVKP